MDSDGLLMEGEPGVQLTWMDAKVGDDFNAYFKAQDHIFDVEITPNRGDALSIRGLARDIAAATGCLSMALGTARGPNGRATPVLNDNNGQFNPKSFHSTCEMTS